MGSMVILPGESLTATEIGLDERPAPDILRRSSGMLLSSVIIPNHDNRLQKGTPSHNAISLKMPERFLSGLPVPLDVDLL